MLATLTQKKISPINIKKQLNATTNLKETSNDLQENQRKTLHTIYQTTSTTPLTQGGLSHRRFPSQRVVDPTPFHHRTQIIGSSWGIFSLRVFKKKSIFSRIVVKHEFFRGFGGNSEKCSYFETVHIFNDFSMDDKY